MERGTKASIIKDFLMHFKRQWDVTPIFTLTDKDFSEINAFLDAFPEAKHQLCFWHCLRAIKTRLSILRRRPAFYDVEEFKNEFGSEVDSNFVPEAQNSSVVCAIPHLHAHIY
jgi:hypothetical protein